MAKLIKTSIDGVYAFTATSGNITYYGRIGRNVTRLGSKKEGHNEESISLLYMQTKASNAKLRTRVTLNLVFGSFLNTVLNAPTPTKNHLDYIARYELHIRKEIGDRELRRLTGQDMRDLYNKILSIQSEAQAYHVLNVVRFLYSHAIAVRMYDGVKPFGKAAGFPLLTPKRRREAVYSQDDVTRILKELKKTNVDTHDMVLVSFLTGARFGEIANIQEMHIDKIRKVVKLVDTKSGYDRTIPLPNVVVDLFTGRMKGIKNRYIFTNRNGEPYKSVPRCYDKVLEKLNINYGVEDSRFKRKFHTLRHSYATLMLDKRAVELKDLQVLLGHENITTTQRYLHANSLAMRAAAEFANNFVR